MTNPFDKPTYAFHTQPDGTVDCIGVISNRMGDNWQLNLIDPLMANNGFWSLTDERRDLPWKRLSTFADKMDCLKMALSANNLQRMLRAKAKAAAKR